MNKRMLWLDSAKAIAIIAMIIGHVVPLGSITRIVIFSFHMPLFFISTGFTQKRIANYTALAKQIKKDIKRLLVPCIGASLASVFLVLFLQEDKNFVTETFFMAEKLLWSSAVDIKGHPALGALWFLIALFWGKTVFALIQVMFSEGNQVVIYLFCAVFGWILSEEMLWFPQALDIIPMIVFFLGVGQLLHKYKDQYQEKQKWVVGGSFAFWFVCVSQRINLEMGTRYYPFGCMSLLEAIAGSICVFALAEALNCNRKVCAVLTFIGRHSLALLCIHTLDWPLSFFWVNESVWATSILRLLTDLAILIFGVGLRYIIQKMIPERKRKETKC